MQTGKSLEALSRLCTMLADRFTRVGAIELGRRGVPSTELIIGTETINLSPGDAKVRITFKWRELTLVLERKQAEIGLITQGEALEVWWSQIQDFCNTVKEHYHGK